MTDGKDSKFAMFEIYLATAERVSDRRVQANSWMLSVNSAIVALYGYLQSDKLAASQRMVWLWAIPTAGAIVCLAWSALLKSYRELNRAKFAVLAELEKDLPVGADHTRARDLQRTWPAFSFASGKLDTRMLCASLCHYACCRPLNGTRRIIWYMQRQAAGIAARGPPKKV